MSDANAAPVTPQKPFTKEDLEAIVAEGVKTSIKPEVVLVALRGLLTLNAAYPKLVVALQQAIRLVEFEGPEFVYSRAMSAFVALPCDERGRFAQEVRSDYCQRCWKYEGACVCPKADAKQPE